MIFTDNRYTLIYLSIMERARRRGHVEGYSERHHVIPRALGGTNDTSNLVLLTAKEHFLAHRLLPKMTRGRDRCRMVSALWAMCNLRSKFHARHTPTSHQYQHAREMYSAKVKSQMRGIPKSAEHRAKIGAKHAGKSLSIETREKIAKARKERGYTTVQTAETRAKLSLQRTGGKNPAAKSCVFRGEEYDCLRSAARQAGITEWFVKKDPTFKYI